MRLTHVLALGLLASVAACGGGDDDGPAGDAGDTLVNPGFPVPTKATAANNKVNGAWVEVGPADWTCLGTASTDAPSTQAIALSGKITDFQTGNGVATATVTAFPGIEIGGNSASAVSLATTDDTRGDFTLNLPQLPSGTTRYGFKVEATTHVKTYLLNQYFDPTMATSTRSIAAVSTGTATALPAFVGVTLDLTQGVLAGAFRDCAGDEVSNAVATVSSVSAQATHLPGAATYYFSAASSSLPVRHNVAPVSNKDGLFVILNIPPQTAPAFVQIWGFKDAADLADGQMSLLSELASPVEANAVITGSFEPLRN